MAKFKVRDNRIRERYGVDDAYINGVAKYLDTFATAVYNSLCRHADFKTQETFPSQEKIAEQHNISLITVKRKIKLLKDYNIIQVKRVRSKKGQFKHNVYILMDKSVWKYPGISTDTWTTRGNQRYLDRHKPMVSQRYPKVTHNKKVTHIWNFYISKAKTKELLLPARKVKITARLKTFTEDQIKQAITNCFNSPFHIGKNDRGWIANADFVFNSDKNIDNLLNLKVKDNRTWEEKEVARLLG